MNEINSYTQEVNNLEKLMEEKREKLKKIKELNLDIESLNNKIREEKNNIGKSIIYNSKEMTTVPTIDFTYDELIVKLKEVMNREFAILEPDFVEITKGSVLKIPYDILTSYDTEDGFFPKEFWKVPRNPRTYYDKFWEREEYGFGYDGFYLIETVDKQTLFIPYGVGTDTNFYIIDIFRNTSDLKDFFKKVIDDYKNDESNIVNVLGKLINQ